MLSQSQNQTFCLFDNGEEEFRNSLVTIDSNLGVKEVEHLKFLCQDFIPYKKLEKSESALDVFDHLIAEELLTEEDPFLLAELLYIMKKNSLLKYLGLITQNVNDLLLTQKKVSSFRKLLYELSEEMDTETIKNMRFVLKEPLTKTQPSSLSFLEHLEKQTLIDEDNLTLLEKLCTQFIPFLNKRINTYKREREAEQSQLRANGVAVSKECIPVMEEATGRQEKEVSSISDFKEMLQALPESPEPVYRMDHKYRGHCVVINNRDFTSLRERQGTEKDAECLKRVFQWLGFIVNIYDNVTKKKLDEVLKEYRSRPDHADGDCFVFCVLSHGQFGAVYSSDDALIPIREITSQFTARQCPDLANKPKLFFIQACQGENTQSSAFTEADAINSEPIHPPLEDSIPDDADFLLGLATVPGYVSFRHKEKGSWYIQSLYNCLKECVPRGRDILSILTAVNDNVSQQGGAKKQMPQPAFTLRKKVIFPVPQNKLL